MKRAILLGMATVLVAVPTVALGAVGSPSVTTGTATGVGNTSATVHGTVNPEGQTTQYAFQYGTTKLYGHETTLTAAGSGSTTIAVASTIGGLTPGTSYHFRIIAISSGGTSTGSDQSFKTTGTAPVPTTPPTVSTGASSGVSPSGATVSGSVNPNGLDTKYYFEFGTTNAYGFQTSPVDVGSGSAAKQVSGQLSGLGPNQTYHYRLDAVNAGGTSVGVDAMFTTTTPPPGASTLKLFGRTGFVSPGGVGGVLVGCIGQNGCTGSLTLSRGGVTLAHRGSFSVGGNDGGVVHINLNATGQAMLRHQLRVNVVVSQQGGSTSTGIITLVRFS